MTQQLTSARLQPELIKAYNAFVAAVEPVGVRLVSVQLSANASAPGGAEALLTSLPARYEMRDGGFTAIQPFGFKGTGAGGAHLAIELELAVDYDSAVPVTRELFEVFGQVNLPLNAHPFLRETVASLTMRAGWPPLILPAFVKAGRSPGT